jgi:hypothetical protein
MNVRFRRVGKGATRFSACAVPTQTARVGTALFSTCGEGWCVWIAPLPTLQKLF